MLQMVILTDVTLKHATIWDSFQVSSSFNLQLAK